MSNDQAIVQKVQDIIVDQLGIKDTNKVNLDSSFINDLGADSLDTVELIMELEQEFNIDIPDEEAAEINTVQDVVDYIVKAQD